MPPQMMFFIPLRASYLITAIQARYNTHQYYSCVGHIFTNKLAYMKKSALPYCTDLLLLCNTAGFPLLPFITY